MMRHLAKPSAALEVTAFLLLLGALAGCATFDPPKSWEKGELAKPEMQFAADRLEARMNQHVYTSKEGASGGDAIGGGGCGCN